MIKFYCSICNKDLGPSMDMLNDPEKVYDMHMSEHIRISEGDIWQYLLEHRWELPTELQKLENDRIDTIKELVIQKTHLRMMIDNGDL